MLIIDAHTHCYPSKVANDPAAFARQQREPRWLDMVQSPLQGWASRDAMLAAMDAAGVSRAILLSWYWENPDTCRLQNEWHARWMARDPDRFVPLAAFHPNGGETLLSEIRDLLRAGFRGVGELHPPGQGYPFDAPLLDALCHLLVQSTLPLSLHVTDPLGGPYIGRVETPFDAILGLARRFPNLPLILAHWGGGLCFQFLNKHLAGSLARAMVDTAASPLLYTSSVWGAAVSAASAERILFGSDFPLRLFPRSEPQPELRRLVTQARKHLPPSAQAEVFAGNARRVFKLP